MLWVTDVNYPEVLDQYKNVAYYKPKSDYTAFLKEINAQTIGMYFYKFDDESDESINARVDGMLANFHEGDTLIVQVPVYIRPKNYIVLIEHIHNIFHGKVIGMFHDYDGLLFGEQPTSPERQEKLQSWIHFNDGSYDLITPHFDALIVHSENFKNVLKKRLNYEKPIIVQGPFGYKIPNEINIPEHHFSKNIIFTGALEKAKYLKEIPSDWKMDVFGPKFGDELNSSLSGSNNINYHGQLAPSELPQHLPDGFGLVWASDSFDQVIGLHGNYLRYTYPHKISAYLTAKVPIIVWSQSAAANWIVKNGLGFAVDNLADISVVLNQMTEEKYKSYQRNLAKMSNLIREGVFEKQAAIEAYQAVNQEDYLSQF